ncbi:hypothetical protein A3D71_00105 [Candidatus Kaiserbacteria bacterium RIFCSPHIGHO2_02_FULL_55_20]|uniref:Uncharacterized protein n=1 Tax=Candidatus Kaiserbacteria bacterium RIFCSPHIGHO2_02_FULL_55_20 TaxID=1798497 RepID=A0A1F6DWD9_9BACT|nr:MAG: hypothetical protein A2680_01740 [Candidatus Kaiserbacteria bacterium RIFCSPHIGHO2_01_FULL_55_37]OGG65342.1 MAG: hypothetical protein A3D71_00105 [Candidatus Kaiserbacteria bacterium RIFCSPHIGHO2_02_FULL_55_20]
MDGRNAMNFPADARPGWVLHCTGRLHQPDKLTIRLDTINLETLSILAWDIENKGWIRLSLHRGGTGHLVLVYLGATFGKIEVVSQQ